MAQIFTKKIINTTFNINTQMGINAVSVVLVSGTATILGDLSTAGVESEQVDLVIGQPVNVSVPAPNVIDKLTIDATAGTVTILARQ